MTGLARVGCVPAIGSRRADAQEVPSSHWSVFVVFSQSSRISSGGTVGSRWTPLPSEATRVEEIEGRRVVPHQGVLLGVAVREHEGPEGAGKPLRHELFQHLQGRGIGRSHAPRCIHPRSQSGRPQLLVHVPTGGEVVAAVEVWRATGRDIGERETLGDDAAEPALHGMAPHENARELGRHPAVPL